MSYSNKIADHFALNVECDKYMNPDKYFEGDIHYQPLSVSTLRSLFVCHAICLTFAFVCFVGELAHFYNRKTQLMLNTVAETSINDSVIADKLVTYTIRVTCLYDQCEAVELACEDFRTRMSFCDVTIDG
jgi:hypothetical protein